MVDSGRSEQLAMRLSGQNRNMWVMYDLYNLCNLTGETVKGAV